MEDKVKKIVPRDKDDNDVNERTLVVNKLPTEPVRAFEEDGIRYNLITTEEALTKLLNK